MSQRFVEIVIGRLVTDEQFRETFRRGPHEALTQLLDRGMHLTPAELAALVAMPPDFWDRVAEHVDPRLQKADLTS